MTYVFSMTKAILGIAMVFFVTSAALLAPSFATSGPQRALDQPSKAAILEAYGKLPLSFEANQGQTDGQVRFLARGQGYGLFLTANEAVLDLHTPAPQPDAAGEVTSTTGTVLH